jgi:hypothetical protein
MMNLQEKRKMSEFRKMMKRKMSERCQIIEEEDYFYLGWLLPPL